MKELKLKRGWGENWLPARLNPKTNSYWICKNGIQYALGKIPAKVKKITLVFCKNEPKQGDPTWFYPIVFRQKREHRWMSRYSASGGKRWSVLIWELGEWIQQEFFPGKINKWKHQDVTLWLGIYWEEEDE